MVQARPWVSIEPGRAPSPSLHCSLPQIPACSRPASRRYFQSFSPRTLHHLFACSVSDVSLCYFPESESLYAFALLHIFTRRFAANHAVEECFCGDSSGLGIINASCGNFRGAAAMFSSYRSLFFLACSRAVLCVVWDDTYTLLASVWCPRSLGPVSARSRENHARRPPV